jgi:amidophosphoribosyltransferase
MKVNNVPLYKNKDKDGSYAVKFKSYYRHNLKIKEECAVFGINDNDDAAALTALGLHALQHRGQEGCGIVTYDKKKFYSEKRLGLVGDNFTKAQTLDKLPGNAAIGHNRYSTSGGDTIRNVQPFFADIQGGGISIAHNGNLTNALMLHETLVKDGAIFHTTSDTETIVQLIARSKKISIIDKIIDALWQIQGGYALTILSNEVLIGVRDPFGIRPLVLGKLNHSYIIASETCALDIIGAKYLREIENGEIVVIKNGKMRSIKPFPSKTKRPCIFEYVYFARPDSILQGQCAYEYRKNLGTQLAKECDINPDIVVPVPDSGVPSALGFSQATDKNFELGLIRNHYVGRTFIEPSQNIRSLGVKLKLNANKSCIKVLYDAGAKEVHVLIACPEIKFPDFYGVDTPTKKELLAANKSNEEICKYIGAKSLKFLSLDGLYRAMGYEKRNNEKPQFSDHHFTGDYPIKPLDNLNDDKIIQLSLLSLASSH